MAENTVQITDENFEATVLKSDKPVLVDFGTEWCPPCKMLAPVIAEVADEYKDKITVGSLDTESNPQTAVKFKITAVPTLILFKEGEEVERLVGFRDKAALTSVIDAAL